MRGCVSMCACACGVHRVPKGCRNLVFTHTLPPSVTWTRPRYVRIKRKNSTIFLHVEPSDNFAALKQKIGEINGVPPSSVMLYADRNKVRVTPQHRRARASADKGLKGALCRRSSGRSQLVHPVHVMICVVGMTAPCSRTHQDRELIDLASISDVEITNDAVLYAILKKENSEAWEDISIEPFEGMEE